jgi:hypothetical protein
VEIFYNSQILDKKKIASGMVSTSCADSYLQIKRAELVQSGVKQATFANVGVGFIPILQVQNTSISPKRGRKKSPLNPWRMGINPTPTLA